MEIWSTIVTEQGSGKKTKRPTTGKGQSRKEGTEGKKHLDRQNNNLPEVVLASSRRYFSSSSVTQTGEISLVIFFFVSPNTKSAVSNCTSMN